MYTVLIFSSFCWETTTQMMHAHSGKFPPWALVAHEAEGTHSTKHLSWLAHVPVSRLQEQRPTWPQHSTNSRLVSYPSLLGRPRCKTLVLAFREWILHLDSQNNSSFLLAGYFYGQKKAPDCLQESKEEELDSTSCPILVWHTGWLISVPEDPQELIWRPSFALNSWVQTVWSKRVRVLVIMSTGGAGNSNLPWSGLCCGW